VLRAAELDTELQVGSHESGVKGQTYLTHPAGCASCDAVWDFVFLIVRFTLQTAMSITVAFSC